MLQGADVMEPQPHSSAPGPLLVAGCPEQSPGLPPQQQQLGKFGAGATGSENICRPAEAERCAAGAASLAEPSKDLALPSSDKVIILPAAHSLQGSH